MELARGHDVLIKEFSVSQNENVDQLLGMRKVIGFSGLSFSNSCYKDPTKID